MSITDVLTNRASWHVENCDVLEGLAMLPPGCVQCAVTSPPYWGLRDYGVDGQLGLEKTPEDFVAAMVAVFRDVRRVLRDDGTLWLNIGDSYNAYNGGAGPSSALSQRQSSERPQLSTGYGLQCKALKPKDLIGIPWRLAEALKADGWYLRSEVIWHKRAPMPESVTDRPTKGHEQVFMLTKNRRYFYDIIASSEKAVGGTPGNKTHRGATAYEAGDEFHRTKVGLAQMGAVEQRNMRTVWDGGPSLQDVIDWLGGRVPAETLGDLLEEMFAVPKSVWTLSPESYKGSHFATMPTELARKCLLAGTSEKGCCSRCGSPLVRVLEKNREATRPGTNSKVGKRDAAIAAAARPGRPDHPNIVGNRDPQRHCTTVETIGWKRTCECDTTETKPCLVLDCFNGAGTTGVVARRMGLRYVGLELNPDYAEMARRRIRADAPLFNTNF